MALEQENSGLWHEIKELGQSALKAGRAVFGGSKQVASGSAGILGGLAKWTVSLGEKTASLFVKSLRTGFDMAAFSSPLTALIAATAAGLGLGKMWKRHNGHVDQEKQIAVRKQQIGDVTGLTPQELRSQSIASLGTDESRMSGTEILARRQQQQPVLTGANR